MKNRLLAVAAAGEALTGLVLLVYPPIVVRLLFGAELTGVSIPVARVLGIALIGLGTACWPCASASRALCGMLTYSALAMAYLCISAFAANGSGLSCGRQLCCMQS